MRRIAACLALLLAGAAAPAQQEGLAAQLSRAEDALDRAAQALFDAEAAQNRITALTRVIRAHDAALSSLRKVRREAAARERTITADLRGRADEIAGLLYGLWQRGRAPEPGPVLHPSGPVAMARASMILGDVDGALAARARALRTALEEVAALRAVHADAAEALGEGQRRAEDARAQLGAAIAARAGLPRRFTEDPIEAALLAASAQTLTEVVAGLGGIAVDEVPGSLPDITARKGSLPLPVLGTVRRGGGETGSAGEARPGITVVTPPRALVTTPVPATLRYRGPLLDYGKVIILEPQAGLVMILAGLGTVYGRPGEVLPGGSPVGLMGEAPGDGATTNEGGAGPDRMLYIEVRKDNSPVDPLAWFATDKEG